MQISRPDDIVGRNAEWERLVEFATNAEATASLGIVWGRRRVGKSFMLGSLAEQTNGFYYQAVRGSSGEALRDLGERLGAYQRSAAPLALPTWDAAVDALMTVGRDRSTVAILDEFPYLLEHTPALDSIIQRAYGPRAALRQSTQTRMILCGSAVSVMARLLTGTAPLRGRAGLDLRIAPFDFRVARQLHGIEDFATAAETYAVVGGVAAYAREMSENDLPKDADDFERWICRRVLSPAAPLFGEVDLLLGEDPATSKARKPNLYHAALAGVAVGNHTWSALSSYVKLPISSLHVIVEALLAADFVVRIEDPVRDNRPTYQPADSLLRFHYAVIRRNQMRLARHGVDTRSLWRDLAPTFRSQVLGPCFENMARYWATHFAARATLGGSPDHVGPTTLTLPDGHDAEVDVVVAADDSVKPGERTVRALGEAKVGAHFTVGHLRRLEQARVALGDHASAAKLLFFGQTFDDGLRAAATKRTDLELVDLRRLYEGD
jgi:hypothetical protein